MMFTEEQGRAVVNNFYAMLERNSNAAQTLQEGAEGISGARFSGVAVDLYYMTVDLVDRYGYAIAGECVERVAMYQPEMSDPRYFYEVSTTRNLSDLQEAFADEMDRALDQMASELQREKEREDAERERRREEEKAVRERARQQAEMARATEEKYAASARQVRTGSSGILGKAASSIGEFFGKVFEIGKMFRRR